MNLIRFLVFVIIAVLFGCATPVPQKTVSVTKSPVLVRKSLQSIIAPTGFVNLVPKDIELEWTPPDPDTNGLAIVGYNLYYGIESRFNDDGTWPAYYPNVINLQNVTNAPVIGLRGATTYYFAVAALDQDEHEGDLSTEAVYTTPIVLDVFFEFNQPVSDVTLQWSPNLSQWIDLGTTPTNGVWRLTGDPSVPRFYRGKATSTP